MSGRGPITICVINLKGGVGKSTITALLARYGFQHRNLNVLAVDLDPQANLSQGLMHQNYNNFLRQSRPSIVEVFNGYVQAGFGGTGAGVLNPADVPQDIMRAGARSLELIASRFDFSDRLLQPMYNNPHALAQYLSAHHRDKDIVLIDCTPTESILTTAAYHASSGILIPVKPEYFATVGFPLLNQSIQNYRTHNRGSQIAVIGVVINNSFYDGGNDGGPEKATAMQDIMQGANHFGWPIYSNQLDHSRGYPKTMRGDNSYPGNAQYFPIFAREFFTSIGL